MKVIDRIILSTLTIGILVLLIGLYIDRPSYALSIDASNVDGLKRYVENIVEDCSVSGQVYVYDIFGSEGYGRLNSSSISC